MANISVPQADMQKCTRCGICIESCPETALHFDGDDQLVVIAERCTYCGTCEAVCPEGAVALAYIISWSDNFS